MAEECPFCKGTMEDVTSTVLETHTEIIKQCKECGFRAVFFKKA